jgi:hypothetical protein
MFGTGSMELFSPTCALQETHFYMPAVLQLFDEAFRKPYPNVTRYFLTLVNQPEFKKVLGEVKLAKETMKYTPPKKESKPEQPKKESKPAPAAVRPAHLLSNWKSGEPGG